MRGKIIRLMGDKKFGFIEGEDQKQYFFHFSGFNGFWDDLVNDFPMKKNIPVSFTPVESPKGPRADEVTRMDGGVIPTD
jgi:cold shock CspA family protein